MPTDWLSHNDVAVLTEPVGTMPVGLAMIMMG